MWNITPLWFEIALVSILLLLGHIFLGHFEERTSPWRKLAKYVANINYRIVNLYLFWKNDCLEYSWDFPYPSVVCSWNTAAKKRHQWLDR